MRRASVIATFFPPFRAIVLPAIFNSSVCPSTHSWQSVFNEQLSVRRQTRGKECQFSPLFFPPFLCATIIIVGRVSSAPPRPPPPPTASDRRRTRGRQVQQTSLKDIKMNRSPLSNDEVHRSTVNMPTSIVGRRGLAVCVCIPDGETASAE